ncbi:MAG TPA: TetR/AcrR family transcriptional regulator [Flavisolibacter sp.]
MDIVQIKMNTREKILYKALEMFNERGIEYVGLRELAGMLDMRVSNITYYFPTKDDLVFELSKQLREANSELLVETRSLTMTAFLEMLHRVYRNHVRFRCLLLSFVHLMHQNARISAAYRKTQELRSNTIHTNLTALEEAGYLKPQDASDKEYLVSTISLISRFWISEAAVLSRKQHPFDQIRHYLFLVTKLLTPHATAKGKDEIRNFLAATENALPHAS